MDGDEGWVKRNGKVVGAMEIFIAGEEEAVKKAWEEISQLPECISSEVELFKRDDESYIPAFNLIIDNLRSDRDD